MAFNFTFADNQRLGLQIVGANSTGTSEQPIGFKRVVVDNDNNDFFFLSILLVSAH